jgi:hypothetical protein
VGVSDCRSCPRHPPGKLQGISSWVNQDQRLFTPYHIEPPAPLDIRPNAPSGAPAPPGRPEPGPRRREVSHFRRSFPFVLSTGHCRQSHRNLRTK